MDHRLVVALNVPEEATKSRRRSPAGRASVTSIPVAMLGPLFRTRIVNLTESPGAAAGLSTVLVSEMSTICPSMVRDAASLEGLVSG